ncbi:MAG: ankyrin repeat domain-containing protein [Candidatus Midichloria sp.]|nr:ankyrin repeat domain-containing protein [Candidatus Midichloria sp.]
MEYIEIARFAIQQGGDVNFKGYSRLPIQVAVQGNQYEMVKLLYENGADLTKRILFWAISDKHLESGIVPYLVEECDVDFKLSRQRNNCVNASNSLKNR